MCVCVSVFVCVCEGGGRNCKKRKLGDRTRQNKNKEFACQKVMKKMYEDNIFSKLKFLHPPWTVLFSTIISNHDTFSSFRYRHLLQRGSKGTKGLRSFGNHEGPVPG